MRKENGQAVGTAAPPSGFRRSGTANAVGWWNQAKAGNILSGKLLGIYNRKDSLRTEGTSKFFQVQVDLACEVRAERGEDARMMMAKAGDVVNVNFGPKTAPWEALCTEVLKGAEYAVYAVPAGTKSKIGGGRQMHNIEAFQKMVRPADVEDDGIGAELEEPEAGGASA